MTSAWIVRSRILDRDGTARWLPWWIRNVGGNSCFGLWS